MKKHFAVLFILFLLLAGTAQAEKKDQLRATAGSVTLNWTQSTVLPTCSPTVTTGCCNPACPVLSNKVYRGATTAGGDGTTPTTAPGQTYFSVVTATNSQGESGKSNDVSATIPIPQQGAVPNVPTGLTGAVNWETVVKLFTVWYSSNGNQHGVALKWNAPPPISAGQTGYGVICPTPTNACRYDVYRNVGSPE